MRKSLNKKFENHLGWNTKFIEKASRMIKVVFFIRDYFEINLSKKFTGIGKKVVEFPADPEISLIVSK